MARSATAIARGDEGGIRTLESVERAGDVPRPVVDFAQLAQAFSVELAGTVGPGQKPARLDPVVAPQRILAGCERVVDTPAHRNERILCPRSKSLPINIPSLAFRRARPIFVGVAPQAAWIRGSLEG